MSRKGIHHKSPVELHRMGPLEVVIRFPNRWLGFSPENNLKRVDLIRQIRSAPYLDGVVVRAFANDISIVASADADGCPSLQAESSLEKTVHEVIHMALVFFAENQGNVYRFSIGGQVEDVLLFNQCKKVYEAAGISAAEEFQSWTREEVCQLPSVETDDVLILERSMAKDGLFFKDSDLPPYRG